MRNFSDKICRENQNTHFLFSEFLSPTPHPPNPENRAVYEIMWKNTVERGKAQTTIWRMRFAWLDTRGYKYTLGICDAYCSSRTATVAQTRLSVKLYVLFLSCWKRGNPAAHLSAQEKYGHTII